MEIYLYNTKDDEKVLNKMLIDELIIPDIRLKNPVDLNNPTLSLSSKIYLNYNYAYIPEFKRYYFIDSLIIQSNNIYVLNLSIDVLFTYATEILTSEIYLDTKKSVQVFSDINLELENNNIIIMRGGIYG